jgi:curved DNA-binding protein CbpA
MTSHYETLGIPPNATTIQVRAAYRREASRYHPDHATPGEEATAAVRMAAVNEAYRVLSDPELRKAYDETGSAERPMTPEELVRAAAWKNVTHLFGQCVLDTDHDDPVRLCVRAVRENLKRMRRIVKDSPHGIALIEERITKLRRRTKGENMLVGIALQELDKLKARVTNLGEEIKIAECMLELLDEYAYGDEAQRTTFWTEGYLTNRVQGNPTVLKIDTTGG